MKKIVNLELSVEIEFSGTKRINIEYPVEVNTVLESGVYLDELEEPKFESLKTWMIESIDSDMLRTFLEKFEFIDKDYDIDSVLIMNVENAEDVIKTLISENFFNVILPEPKYLFHYKKLGIKENFYKTEYTIYEANEIIHVCKTITEVFDFLKEYETADVNRHNINIEKF